MALENFRLRVFRTVAQTQGFRRAAETLFLTQPAVTLQIKALEEEVGTQLFDRTGHQIALTRAGRVLLGYADRLHELAEEAEREVANLRGEYLGELPIGASTTIAQYVLPRLIGEFLAGNAGVRPAILGANTEVVLKKVADCSLAVGLVEGPAMRRDLHVEPFLTDVLTLIVPPRHEFSDSSEVRASSLQSEPLILRENGSGTRRIVERALKRAGVNLKRLHVAMELDSTEAIKSAVEAGLGVGFVPRRATRKEIELGTLREIRVEGLDLKREFSLVYRRSPEPEGPARAFVEFLRALRSRSSYKGMREADNQ
jgi:DNA-binding transcriptional LysR family regulator